MKSRRFQHKYRKSASKLHRAVGEVLRTSPLFSLYEIYQEYPVNRVNPGYLSAREHFDWAIPQLYLVIECMGKQHETPVAFDGDKAAAIKRFKRTKELDEKKKQAALDANYIYMTIDYNELNKVNKDFLLERYQTLLDINKTNPSSTFFQKQAGKRKALYYNKDKAKKYRQGQYKRYKEWKREKKERKNVDKDKGLDWTTS